MRLERSTEFDPESYAIVIPARFESSRFPGKPLALIDGVSVIERVYRQCLKAESADRVIVATDDQRIVSHCRSFGASVELTSSDCATGTDRIHQVVKGRGLDWALNVQGDEPFVRPTDIEAVREGFMASLTLSGGSSSNALLTSPVVNAMAPIVDQAEWSAVSVPKVVFDQSDRLLYMSRAPIPGQKSMTFTRAWKQICIYAFTAHHLDAFSNVACKTDLEALEDIEILRFLEKGIPVQMVRVASGTVAIDHPEDVQRAESLIASGILG